MEFINGFKITDDDNLSLYQINKEQLLIRIVEAYSYQLYVCGFANADPHAGNISIYCNDEIGEAKPILFDFGMTVNFHEHERKGFCNLLNGLNTLLNEGINDNVVKQVSLALKQIGYQNSQSSEHPERDVDFFIHLLRDTGDKQSQVDSTKEFRNKRRLQRNNDLKDDPNKQGRFFKEIPDHLIFLFRILGLIRGLCTTLNTQISYLDIMPLYTKYALLQELKKTN